MNVVDFVIAGAMALAVAGLGGTLTFGAVLMLGRAIR